MPLVITDGVFYDSITNSLQPNTAIHISSSGRISNPRKRFFEEVDRAHKSSPSGEEENNCEDDVVTIDCSDYIIAPGFIDIQCNGAFGVDFSVPPSELEGGMSTYKHGLSDLGMRILQTGVTSYCPTLVTCSPSTYREVLPLFPDRQSDDDESGSSEARIIGLHLEGPYFAMEKKGAHNKNYITDPKTTPLKKAYGNDILQHLEAGKVKIVTMAPELAGGNKIIKQLSCKGVKVSMGHSMATCEEGEVGVEEGATLITHLFNAMPPFHHREPGLIGTVLGSRNNSRAENENGRVGLGQGELYRPYYSIICDGIHCHKNAVNMAHNSHPGGTILVTDAMSAMGLDDGAHKLGTMEVVKKGLRATIKGTDTLAGSVVSLDECLRKFVEFTNCEVGEAIGTITKNPAEFLGIADDRGTLKVGGRGDVTILDRELNVVVVVLGGRVIVDKRKRTNKND